MRQAFTIASNQGAVGGGEVMLLSIAEAARELGRDVRVIAPEEPAELVNASTQRSFETIPLPSKSVATYLRHLRSWDRVHRNGVLWCNGLRPAVATAGHRNRVVHLHQLPSRKLIPLAAIASRGATEVIVPSTMMAEHVPGATVMWNWTATPIACPPRSRRRNAPFTVGFLGRLSPDKGILVLCAAMKKLLKRRPGEFRLIAAGETRFVKPRAASLVATALHDLGDDVELPGWMSREQFFSEIDLAVFPSIWAEPFGLVAAEAMSARCRFIVSDAGALPEVVGPESPWISPAGNATALADLIERAERADWTRLLDAAHARWVSEFSPNAGRTRLAEVLDQIGEQERRRA